jgi:hypothetical protein
MPSCVKSEGLIASHAHATDRRHACLIRALDVRSQTNQQLHRRHVAVVGRTQHGGCAALHITFASCAQTLGAHVWPGPTPARLPTNLLGGVNVGAEPVKRLHHCRVAPQRRHKHG